MRRWSMRTTPSISTVSTSSAMPPPRVQRAAAPRDVDRTVRDGHAVAPHELHVPPAREEAIALRRHVAVTDREIGTEQPDRLQQLHRRHAVFVHDVLELDHA